MACKYMDGGVSGSTYGPGPKVCPAEQATAWDVRDKKCFKIFGVGVTIADRTASIQGGFEVFNFNMHTSGSATACVNCYQLPGVVVV